MLGIYNCTVPNEDPDRILKKVLLSSSKSITEIALDYGFDNSSYFCKVLRAITI
ncbi:MAG: AraC family transcriptional regulator [Clostridiaceae bacterium]|nr:AraC family transcriptional regulator [Clostridiaceae bacterium]